MKKDVLENIEETREKRKLSKEAKKKIKNRILANFFIYLSIFALIIGYIYIREKLSEQKATYIYDICAVVILITDIVLVEVAYRKNSMKLVVTGLEICIIAIFSLFSTYIFYKMDYIPICLGLIEGGALYYCIKIIVIYKQEKNKYLYEIGDFSDIIKKESKDEKAELKKNNRMKIAMEEREKLLKDMDNEANKGIIDNDEQVEKKPRKRKTKANDKTSNKKIDNEEIKEEVIEKTKTTKKTPNKTTKSKTVAEKKIEPKEVKEETKTKKTTSSRVRKTVTPKIEETVEEKPKEKKATSTKAKKEKVAVVEQKSKTEEKPKTRKTTTATTKKSTTTTSKKTTTKTAATPKKTTKRTTK